MARAPAPILNLNGYTDLPPDTVATIVTYLEMSERPRLRRRPRPPGWSLQRIDGDLPRYRILFREVGEPWLWFSRSVIPDAALRAILGDPMVEAYALHDGTRDIGLLELDFRRSRECELVYFGLVSDAIGQGAGRFLMDEAVRRAFRAPIDRFTVHTCSLDHPSALAFYLRTGFVPYKRAVEVAPDPRLAGRLPLEAGPHAPIIRRPAAHRRSPARVDEKRRT
jgi:GNAT superfamily N-acetyltransferase